MRPPGAPLLLAPLLALATALTLTLHLPASPNPLSLPGRTHATLTARGAQHAAPLSGANAFVFRNVTPGSYLADVHCPAAAYAPLRVDVRAEAGAADARPVVRAWDTFRGNAWEDVGEARPLRVEEAAGAAGPGVGVELRFLGSKNYFLERPRFSVLSILKSPMILMGLVSMLIVFGMPYLMENMDPEMKAEFEAQQRKGGPMAAVMGGGGGGGGGQQAGNPLSDFDVAAFLAGSNKKKDSGAAGGSGAGDGAAAKDHHGVRR